MRNIYQTEATSIGGRNGMAASSDGHLRAKLVAPVTLGGSGGEGTNPEQLFAAAYAACFLSAIRCAAAEDKTLIADDANVTATIALRIRGGGPGLELEVALGVDLPGIDRGTAERIVAIAKANCPYTYATRSNLDVRVRIA